jgi:type I restriction enzyme S subunit
VKYYRETEFKETEIGKIPKDWRVVKLGGVLNLKRGMRPKALGIGSIPVYGAGGVIGYTNEYLVENDYIIVIGRVGTIDVYLAQGKIWVNENAFYSESYDRSLVYLPFIYYLLKSKIKEIKRFAFGTAQLSIRITVIRDFPIPLPPLDEQKRIADVFLNVDEAITQYYKQIDTFEKMKKTLNALLTGEIRLRKY